MGRFQFEVSGKTRTEHDLLGEKEVPVEALFGIQTLRCVENFDISRDYLSEYPEFTKALGIVKMGAILANHKLGLVNDQIKSAVVAACKELMDGQHLEHFPIDMVQGGAGTSVNMNANEVIANRALEIMGKERGQYQYCSPNDHVNMAQSTNDAYPSAMHIGLYLTHFHVRDAMESLIQSFERKEKEFAGIIKMGRTQLQDAVPMTLGQSFGAYASAMKHELERLERSATEFLEINMGATAIGTGITAEPGYAEECIKNIRQITGWDIKLASNLIEATHDTSCMVSYASALKMIAIRLSKICNDLRILSSGPRTGIAEISLPPKQPGSSIMPGKVNPVIPEVVNQVCFKIISNETAVCMASEAAQLELNVMEPVMVQSIVESSDWMIRALNTLRVECIDGIKANPEHCRNMVENSIGIVTALKPFIGYEKSTDIAKEALLTGKSVYKLVLERGILTKEQMDKILDPANMVKPVKIEI
ncbi:MAG: aspartate ammonia-lyase [Bacteroidetes bacterium GWE2_39_28]|nr:MAG: aspartate ammonia-lyase [Bacteroidetes bacterium GWE2_39_28]OFY15740.1 MAG: aspartate ammonia-lyase [Bacteroidetes bacterium GWF2_39_10]OFZ08858.1 MAG: aspartate ammonia-lyase [Bacteroidetes bacterium RIFOXYB2_FULL_39_7]OFZ12448.1 MAG: aspartate ammonia-lyase [Bacteroidetes bacterium RIFOXYC2_FULL_39_11]HCT94705.1 aspartate ammonia-lyase [Rikenellaceae bacterium]